MITLTPEAAARLKIDAALEAAGWVVQDVSTLNLYASRGVAVREVSLKQGHGEADYLLFVDGQAAGAVEAKKEGETLTSVEVQTAKYADGLPETWPCQVRPLPFLYESTAIETQFTNLLDPEPRSRRVFALHRPETLAEWIADLQRKGLDRATWRGRLRHMPPLNGSGLWDAQITAVENLERSLRQDRPRSLIQMATGSGKTYTAISAIYRLLKFGETERVLFLVDRANLGRQTLKEFQAYVTPDDGRKFTELYNAQLLTSNRIVPVNRVCIATIQRIYSMLRGDSELSPEDEEESIFEHRPEGREPLPVTYNPNYPIETFDLIFTDECHRSIYNLWRQTLEYFDASLVGLTATPSKQTIAFFNRNLVMEYDHGRAVADGVNVGSDTYSIQTAISAGGSTVEAGFYVDKRDRLTRAVRWEELEDDLTYSAKDLDRAVVATDQMRTIIRTFRDRLFTEIFPGRSHVPKTLIFAKDDSHADDIVRIVREEFGKGNEFCQKITYRTTGEKPEVLLSSFRNSYYPRIVVTVDMIATGTDTKPLEIVMFMRAVKSRNYYEQMKGRGVRVINPSDLKGVTPDAEAKTRFVIIDCVGIAEDHLTDSQPLEKRRYDSFETLLKEIAFGIVDADSLSSLASRLARLDRQIGETDRKAIAGASGGATLREIIGGIVEALDPDVQIEAARAAHGLAAGELPPPEQIAQARQRLLREAARPLAANPELRETLIETRKRFEQTIDHISEDRVLYAGYSPEAVDRARAMVTSFKEYIEENKDEIIALQVLYSRPYAQRLRFKDIRELAAKISAPPRNWTPDVLWIAHETLDASKVRGSGTRVMTDLVSLVRFAIGEDDELVPYAEQVNARFAAWLAQQEVNGREFTPEQRRWLEAIRDHIASSLGIEPDDFELSPFAQQGGLGRAYQVFGPEWPRLLDELNEALVA